MIGDVPEIEVLEEGDTVRVEYISQRSGNTVDREGEVVEIREGPDGESVVYVHDERRGFFRHTYVALAHAKSSGGELAVGALSVSTEPEVKADEPPDLGRTYAITHRVVRRQTLGVVKKVIRITPGSMTPNDLI